MGNLWKGGKRETATYQAKLFTASGTFVVPPDVSLIWIDGCAGGAGGGGGNPTPGGGGGGGCCGLVCKNHPFAVAPGETLTVTVGAGGAGGAAGADGHSGGSSGVAGSLSNSILMAGQGVGGAGRNPNGGDGGYSMLSEGSPIAGGAGAGSPAVSAIGTSLSGAYVAQFWRFSAGAAGGALTYNGGYARDVTGVVEIRSGGTGGANGGGGGAGGCCIWGLGGAGGSNGAAGANGTGYGGGGGGGSGNAAGGNGSPGFIRIYCLTVYPI